MVPGVSEAPGRTSLQLWVGKAPSGVETPLWGQQPHPALPQLGPWEPWGAGAGPGVGSQQTGSWKGDFSLLTLCLPRRDPGPVSTQETGRLGGGRDGAGRSSLGWRRSRFLWSGLQRGGRGWRQPKAPRVPFRSAQGGLEVLAPSLILWLGTLRPGPGDDLPTRQGRPWNVSSPESRVVWHRVRRSTGHLRSQGWSFWEGWEQRVRPGGRQLGTARGCFPNAPLSRPPLPG